MTCPDLSHTASPSAGHPGGRGEARERGEGKGGEGQEGRGKGEKRGGKDSIKPMLQIQVQMISDETVRLAMLANSHKL